MVTDDLNAYKPISQQLGLAQQLCLAHVRKWVVQRLRRIAGWEEEKALTQWLYNGAAVHDLHELVA